MSIDLQLTGRSGLARVVGVSDTAARDLERRGLIRPVTFVDGRPLFSVSEAEALRAKRDAAAAERRRSRSAVQAA